MNQDLIAKLKDIFLPWRGNPSSDYQAVREAEFARLAIRYKGESAKVRGYRETETGLELVIDHPDDAMEKVFVKLDDPDLAINESQLIGVWGHVIVERKAGELSYRTPGGSRSPAKSTIVQDPARVNLIYDLLADISSLTFMRVASQDPRLPPQARMKTRAGQLVRILARAPMGGSSEPLGVLAIPEQDYPNGEVVILVEGEDIDIDIDQLSIIRAQLEAAKVERNAKEIGKAVAQYEANKPKDYHCKPGDLIYCTGNNRKGMHPGALVGIVEKYAQPVLIQNNDMGFSETGQRWVSGVIAVNGTTYPEDLSIVQGVLVGEDFALYDNHTKLIAQAIAAARENGNDFKPF